MKVMVTGGAGFIGGFLARYCTDAGHSVLSIGTKERAREGWTAGGYEPCDIRDPKRLSHLLSTFRPDRIFHLAAQSDAFLSHRQPRETIDVNVIGTINLYECIREVGIHPLVLVACSSAEYGPVMSEEELPVRETNPLRPLHPYGVSKVAQDLLAAQYFANCSIPSVRVRIFNTTGPGKLGDLCSDLTRRAVEIELGIKPPSLRVGNLRTRRLLVDVRDLVRALWVSTERCQPGEAYNVGGIDIYSVKEVIDILKDHVRKPFGIEQDPALVRGCEERVIAGSIVKFQECSGWAPEIPLSKTVQDMLDWWRKRFTDDLMARSLPSESGRCMPAKSEIGA